MCYYGGENCSSSQTCQMPCYNYCGGGQNGTSYAIVLVLFILLVIILGTRFTS